MDPIFGYDPQRKDVSNIHDLTKMTGLFDCEPEVSPAGTTLSLGGVGAEKPQGRLLTGGSAAPGDVANSNTDLADGSKFNTTFVFWTVIGGAFVLFGGSAALGLTLGRHSRVR